MPAEGPSTICRTLPTGSTLGSAAMMPVRVVVPDFVSPAWQYAVALTRMVAGVAATDAIASKTAHNRRMSQIASRLVPPRYFRYEVDRLGRLSQRKNRTTTAAGMNGPHQASRPKALKVDEPPLTNAI